MTATTLSEDEAQPVAYPDVRHWDGPLHVHTSDETWVQYQATWQRIEWWVNTRWSERAVTYVVEGPGEWTARLEPFSIVTSEVWCNDSWQTAELRPSPLGGVILPDAGPYRITGTAGSDTSPPEAAKEAWRRLHEYLLATANLKYHESAANEGVATGWAAREMQLSGAADLLRPWRRLR